MEEHGLLVDLHDLFIERGLTISTAESCTSGLSSFLLTTQPGSSCYYMGGVNCYSNHSKVSLLGVSQNTLDSDGAVSEATARELAVGSQKRFGTALSLSFTGIAGPDGGSPEKPVGTVWCGLCYHDRVQTRLFSLSGTRHEIRWRSAFEALKWLDQTIRANPE